MQQTRSNLMQQGISMWGILFLSVLLGFVLMTSARLIPVYLDDITVGKLVADLERQSGLKDSSEREIIARLEKSMMVNPVRLDLKEALRVERERGYTTVIVAYERRLHLFSNIDVVASFEHHAQLR